VGEVTIIIRADRNAQTGAVQEIIQVSQEAGFQKFALRGKQGQVQVSQDER
jgi:biopolymer transport protein ExbD